MGWRGNVVIYNIVWRRSELILEKRKVILNESDVGTKYVCSLEMNAGMGLIAIGADNLISLYNMFTLKQIRLFNFQHSFPTSQL